ncbi:hypothetical protein ACJIZ3_022678 [Penstemon smallii]|uniref:Uncharacterized protein n=1 Tax=Penstemon smallii TaxID=265156 RepID=A0ABD3TNZ6_9LAMI
MTLILSLLPRAIANSASTAAASEARLLLTQGHVHDHRIKETKPPLLSDFTILSKDKLFHAFAAHTHTRWCKPMQLLHAPPRDNTALESPQLATTTTSSPTTATTAVDPVVATAAPILFTSSSISLNPSTINFSQFISSQSVPSPKFFPNNLCSISLHAWDFSSSNNLIRRSSNLFRRKFLALIA